MRVLLDNNVILDAMLQRVPWHRDADAILKASALGQVLCATTAAYRSQRFFTSVARSSGPPRLATAVRQYLAAFAILPIDQQTLRDADGATRKRVRGQYSDGCRYRGLYGRDNYAQPRGFRSFPHSRVGAAGVAEATASCEP